MTSQIKSIISFKAPLYQKPQMCNEIETECLFGEKFSIIKKKNEWIYGELKTDNYLGWINQECLGNNNLTTHKVILKNTNIYKESSPKSIVLQKLSLGSLLNIIDIKKNWGEVIFFSQSRKVRGFVPLEHVSEITCINYKWIETCREMINTPYVWGGRTFEGIDCSALLQISMRKSGIDIPRNTSEQIRYMNSSNNFSNIKVKGIKNFVKGTIIFWPGHVGVISKKNILLHANAFHMRVVEEPINTAIERLNVSNLKPIKAYI
jgi:hypothetical protein